MSVPIQPPTPMVTTGVTMMSTFVLPETRRPISKPANAAMNAPRGSPAPLRSIPPVSGNNVPLAKAAAFAPKRPVTAEENTTIRGASIT